MQHTHKQEFGEEGLYQRIIEAFKCGRIIFMAVVGGWIMYEIVAVSIVNLILGGLR